VWDGGCVVIEEIDSEDNELIFSNEPSFDFDAIAIGSSKASFVAASGGSCPSTTGPGWLGCGARQTHCSSSKWSFSPFKYRFEHYWWFAFSCNWLLISFIVVLPV
jgi:hypothetical protein